MTPALLRSLLASSPDDRKAFYARYLGHLLPPTDDEAAALLAEDDGTGSDLAPEAGPAPPCTAEPE